MVEWHIIMSRIGAKIYKTANNKDPMKLVKEFENPLGKEKNRAFQTDSPGKKRIRIAGRTRVYSVGSKNEPHEEAAVQLTRLVGSWITKEATKKRIQKLSIFADPHMSGLLSPNLSSCKSEIVWHHKNFSKMTYGDLNKKVHEFKRA